MSFIPGLGGLNGTANGSMEADPGLFVQQLLDQVQHNSTTPVSRTPVQTQPPPATVTPIKQESDVSEPTPAEALQPPQALAQSGIGIPSPADSTAVDVPQCLIFGGETGEDEFLIPGRCLQKLPQDVLLNLLKDGERMGSVHRLGSTPHWESMVRLNQYLDHGDYKPFKPSIPVEYLDANGNAHIWNNRDSPNAVEIPRATLDLFLREIDLYLFAAKLGYTELRKTCAERLCSRYPKSTESIMALVEKAGPIAVQNEDRGLIAKIIAYINTNCRELTAMPQFLTLLRKLTRGKPPLGSALLEAYFSASEALRREVMSKGLARSAAAEVDSNMTSAPSSKINAPIGPITRPLPSAPASHLARYFNSPFSALEISNLVDALNKQCLVVANDNGYGTLVRENSRKVRNTDFKFQKGELLVADREAHTANGRHNMLVMNSRGEVGDILRTLVKKVPLGLGVLAPEHAVNDGKIAPSRFPDREERIYNPIPAPPHRGRSRSPPPVRSHHSSTWRSGLR
ncbi:uncharacterized protein PV09_08174 [Verruconis gallopava]|uniref:Uncharacterized protein n=1 Tax=Verruconis gallopava TaxID=253628 RepID=A0A0D2AMB8_9PEZI|nr:uncharacterized protein PV09_08174 [Verruconis gallopava]KIW00284.1 hypothetical protein PV09_08174 [Verruconis gallopava]